MNNKENAKSILKFFLGDTLTDEQIESAIKEVQENPNPTIGNSTPKEGFKAMGKKSLKYMDVKLKFDEHMSQIPITPVPENWEELDKEEQQEILRSHCEKCLTEFMVRGGLRAFGTILDTEFG